MFNDSDNQSNITAENSKKSAGMDIDGENEKSSDQSWIEIPRNIRRYKAKILGINTPGSNEFQKLNNLTKNLANFNGFIECKKTPYQKDLWLTAIFDGKQNMLDACEREIFEGNDHKLTPLYNRGDDEIKKRTLVIRDLPLDTDRILLKSILEKAGPLESLKLRLSGSWYRADATFE